ncbi:MAG: hypothetical protein QM796_17045 [Chthoniobacteraceae bacterium]
MKTTHALIERLESRIAPATLVVTNLKDSGDGSLRDTLTQAADGDVVAFASNLHGVLTLSTTVDVTVGVTIQASTPGAVILSGNNQVQILDIDDGDDTTMSNVKLVNLGFTNGLSSSAGGAILDVENLTVSNCNFFSNHVTAGGGGAISIQGDGATVKLLNSRFTFNTASGEGGAVDFIAPSGNLISTGSVFKNNSATDGGALAVANVPTIVITGGKIADNSATHLGGGVYLSNVASATFNTAYITDNSVTATTSATGGAGIAVSASTLKLLSSTIADNTAGGSGGGLLVDATSTANLTSSLISGNIAQWGGGLDFFGNVKMTASKISGNEATQNGGGIYGEYGEQNLNIAGSFITGNQAQVTGGGLYLLNGGYQIINTTIVGGNSASVSGGGMAVGDGNLNVASTTFTHNGAGIGGGIYLFKDTGTLTTHFSTCNIAGNSAVTAGGGIYLASTVLSLKTSTFGGNNATDTGGGLYVDSGANAIVNGSTFQGNSSNYGGGIYFLGQVNIGTSNISSNTAQESGGGIFGAGTQDILIANTQLAWNKSVATDGRGGGLDLTGTGKQSIYHCQIIGNKAANTGGGLAASNGVINLIATTIAANKATFGGGAAFFMGTKNASANFTDCSVTGNKALTIGGGIYSATSNAQILSGTTVSGNSAPANPDLFGTYLQS